MRSRRHTIQALTSICSILALAGSLLSFAGDAEARGRSRRQKAIENQSPNVQSNVQTKDSGTADAGGKQEGSESKPSPAPARSEIRFLFKLDPRLSGPTYGGERWISPLTYMGATAQDTVEARAQAVDAKGRPANITPEWIPSDPEMVTVSPSQGHRVTITVKRAGESKLKVVSQELSKELVVKAKYMGEIIFVEIAQTP